MAGLDGRGSTISTKLTGNIPRPLPVTPVIHSPLIQLSSVITSPACIAQVDSLPIYCTVYKLCMMVHHCLYSDAPAYLVDLITTSAASTGRAGLRSAASGAVAVPWTTSSFGDWSFAVASPCAWNKLPPPLRRVHSAATFKCQLKTFFIS